MSACERRDPKGLAAGGRRGEVVGVTGLDDPCERSRADLVLPPAAVEHQFTRVRDLVGIYRKHA